MKLLPIKPQPPVTKIMSFLPVFAYDALGVILVGGATVEFWRAPRRSCARRPWEWTCPRRVFASLLNGAVGKSTAGKSAPTAHLPPIRQKFRERYSFCV